MKVFIILILILMFTPTIFLGCNSNKLSITSKSNKSIKNIINDFASYCEFNVLRLSPKTEKRLNQRAEALYLKDVSLEEIFKIVLNSNNLSYTYNNKILKIDYLTTKTYSLDYILTSRVSKSNTNIKMQSHNNSNTSETISNSMVGVNISSDDNFKLWGKKLSKDIFAILNRPEDRYKTPKPLINKEAGLITITATYNQHKRVQDYFDLLKSKLENQVLIDLKIYSVELNKNSQIGIDWRQLSNILDFSSNISGSLASPIINIGQTLTFNKLIGFLKTHGEVHSISNPKVLTLNNQSAIISVGKELYYKLNQSTTVTSNSTTTQSSEIIQSVFSGILLDVTPSISNNNEIILKINPSISSIDYYKHDDEIRTIPPDLNKKQISSVIKLKNRDSIILGGLIDTQQLKRVSKIPILGDIWVLGWLFRTEELVEITKELVIVITPHIIKNKPTKTKDLNYKIIKTL